MKLTSSAFDASQTIPSKYTCDGEDVRVPLTISEVPPATQSLALIVDDPDSPSGQFTHWIIWNIPPDTAEIGENLPAGAVEGQTDFGRTGWGGPCPNQGEHHYYFRLYALDSKIDLPSGATKDELKNVINDHTIGQAELIGLYQRPGH